MTSVSHVTAMYATKRRRRNSKNVRTVCNKDSHTKSNPSKRHRERLNQELDTLASLLPFEQSVLSKLDKLSILRLSVSYLRTKSYFQAALVGSRHFNAAHHRHQQDVTNPSRQLGYDHNHQSIEQQQQQAAAYYPAELRQEGDLIVQALNGFLLILTCDGEVFYTSQTVETYLGFHQSDICHQSVYELVHSEDREELMQQLQWNSMISQHQTGSGASAAAAAAASAAADHHQQTILGTSNTSATKTTPGKSPSQMSLQEILASTEHRHLLERNFTVRFRCLLDNTSGFLRLDIRGRIKVLHGQQNLHNLGNSASGGGGVGSGNGGKKASMAAAHADGNSSPFQYNHQSSGQTREPILAFFGVCIPFGPPSLLEMPSKDSTFRSKHRLDLSIISMDSRGKQLLGLNDLTNIINQSEQSTKCTSSGSKPLAIEASEHNSGSSSPVSVCNTTSATRTETATTNTTTSAPVKSENKSSSTTANNSTANSKHSISAYDLVHQDDLSYMASAHQELLKTGASGLIAYRMIAHGDPSKYQWLQTSAKLFYRNSKPDYIMCTHRPLMEEEGRDLLGKRTMDFKVTYLDAGLHSSSPLALTSVATAATVTTSTASVSHLDRSLANCDTRYISGNNSSSSSSSSSSSASLSPQRVARPTNGLMADGSGDSPALSNINSPSAGCGHPISDASTAKQMAEIDHKHQSKKKRKSTGHHDLAYSADDQYARSYDSSYGPITKTAKHNQQTDGDAFYDLDTPLATIVSGGEQQKVKHKKQSSGKSANKKHSSDLKSSGKRSNGKQATSDLVSIEAAATAAAAAAAAAAATTNPMIANSGLYYHQSRVNHHQNQNHHQALSSNTSASMGFGASGTNATDPTLASGVGYPAIQAAAAYAASVAQHNPSHHTHNQHHHHTRQAYAAAAHHHQQLAAAGYHVYGSTTGHQQQQHHHHQSVGSYVNQSSTDQSSSGSSLTSSQHHHNHQASLDSANTYQHQPSNYASAFANHHSNHQTGSAYSHHHHAAVAHHHSHGASYLPEHLLQHYSQSAAARTAALAGWPTHHQVDSFASGQHLSEQHSSGYASANQNCATGSWAAAAAALAQQTVGGHDQQQHQVGNKQQRDLDALSVGSGGEQEQAEAFVAQSYHQVQSSSPSGISNKQVGSSATAAVVAAAALAAQQQRYAEQQHSTKHHNAGPGSLNSDGSSAHRSPLSSESSNGSAAQLVGGTADVSASAVVNGLTPAAAAAAAAIISPSSNYYGLATSDHYSHHQQAASQQATTTGTYAAYQANPYASATQSNQQYDTPTSQHYQHGHYYSHHSHHQQLASDVAQQATTEQQYYHAAQAASGHHGNNHSSLNDATAAVATVAAKFYAGHSNGYTTFQQHQAAQCPRSIAIVSESSSYGNYPQHSNAEWTDQLYLSSQAGNKASMSVDSEEFTNSDKDNSSRVTSEQKGSKQAITWTVLSQTQQAESQAMSLDVEPQQSDSCKEIESMHQSANDWNEIVTKDGPSKGDDGQMGTDTDQVDDGVQRSSTTSLNDSRDPLAQLISSTIGDIMLDAGPESK